MTEEGRQSPLARRLRALRAYEGSTLEEIEKRSGITKETVGELERGKRTPYGSTLKRLAETYDVPLSYLLGEDGERSPVPKAKAPRRSGHSEGSRAEGRLNFYGRLEDLDEGQIREFLVGILEGRVSVEEARERLASSATGSETA